MPISSRHPDYTKHAPNWSLIRDFLAGQREVKSKGKLYLPIPVGTELAMLRGGEEKQAAELEYNNYLARARVPDLVSDALELLIGLIQSKPATYKTHLPEGAAVSDKGETPELLGGRLLRDVVEVGRSIMVVDRDPLESAQAYITLYPAEKLINWVEDKGELVLAVFEEQEKTADSDQYAPVYTTIYREFVKDNDVVIQSVLDENGKVLIKDGKERKFPIGNTNGRLPIVIAGSIDTDPKIDPAPLLPLAECALSAYQLSADYRKSLHDSCAPTPVVKGIEHNAPARTAIIQQGTGTNSLWCLPSTGDAYWLEPSGSGIEANRTAINDELEQAKSLSARLTSTANGVESAQALSIKKQDKNANADSIVKSCESSMVQALKLLAMMDGKPDVVVEFSYNADLTKPVATEAMINVVGANINAGNMPRQVLYSLIVSTGHFSGTYEEWEEAIKNDAPPSNGVANL